MSEIYTLPEHAALVLAAIPSDDCVNTGCPCCGLAGAASSRALPSVKPYERRPPRRPARKDRIESMAGDWIKIRVNLWDDPRIVRIAGRLKADKATIIGTLVPLGRSGTSSPQTAAWRVIPPRYSTANLELKAGAPPFRMWDG